MAARTDRAITRIFLVSCSVALLGGCVLDRTVLLPAIGSATPRQYCPGDVVTASFDLLGEETCPADANCGDFHPVVDLSSSPESFPPQRVNGFTGSVDFSPSADRVEVTFGIDRDTVTIPTARFEGSNRVYVQRTQAIGQTIPVTRITGSLDNELLHDGMCAGSTPVHATVEIPGPPRLSPNMGLSELCNTNPEPVTVILVGSDEYAFDLAPGECLRPGSAGVPADVMDTRMVGVRPMIPDPTVRCGALEGGAPPRPLRTVARLVCR